MSISRKDLVRLEEAMLADSRHYRHRYVSGASHIGIYRIFTLWPDKLKEVEQVDGEWRENAVVYLEANLRFFRSGYDKAQLLRHLKRAEFSADHVKRLREVLLNAVRSGGGVEFRQYCQLAARLNSAGLRVELGRLAKSEDADVRRRSEWMLASIGGVA